MLTANEFSLGIFATELEKLRRVISLIFHKVLLCFMQAVYSIKKWSFAFFKGCIDDPPLQSNEKYVALVGDQNHCVKEGHWQPYLSLIATIGINYSIVFFVTRKHTCCEK